MASFVHVVSRMSTPHARRGVRESSRYLINSLPMDVALFVTCLTDTFYPRAGIAVVKVLEHLGHTVHFPQAQTCCGQPMFNNGCRDEARELAKRMIRVFEPYDCVVTPSGSCAAMIHEYYPELFRADHAWEHDALRFAGKVHEFSSFLHRVLKVNLDDLGVTWPGKATYHYSCHLRGMGVRAPTDPGVPPEARGDALLKQVRSLEYVPMERSEQCCGFGGTFAMKLSDISGAMVRDKVACIRATGAPVVVSNEGGCTMNISGSCRREGLDVRFLHLAEIIAEGLGLMEKSG